MLSSLKMLYDLISPLPCFLPLSSPHSLLPHIYAGDDYTGKYCKSGPCLRWGDSKTPLQGKKTPIGIPTRQFNWNVHMFSFFCSKSVSVWVNTLTLILNGLASDGQSHLPTPFSSFTVQEFLSPIITKKILPKVFKMLSNDCSYEFIC